MISQQMIARRAELMAELFIEELEPTFASKPTADVGWDLLAGFPNGGSGTNVFLIQVKGTDRPVGRTFPVRRGEVDRLAKSNLPALLLVADVSHAKLYYAWLTPDKAEVGRSHTVNVPVVEVTGRARHALATALAGTGPASVAV